jgi:HIRAN domain
MRILDNLLKRFGPRREPSLPSSQSTSDGAAVSEIPTELASEPVHTQGLPDSYGPERPVRPGLREGGDRQPRVKRHYIRYERLEYYPDLPHKIVRCVGMGSYLTPGERNRLDLSTAIAAPEPTNPVDKNAVAIINGDGRKLGYLSAAKAAGYAPIVAKLGALQLDCRMDGSQIMLSLPTLPALRAVASKLRAPE